MIKLRNYYCFKTEQKERSIRCYSMHSNSNRFSFTPDFHRSTAFVHKVRMVKYDFIVIEVNIAESSIVNKLLSKTFQFIVLIN